MWRCVGKIPASGRSYDILSVKKDAKLLARDIQKCRKVNVKKHFVVH